MGKIKGKRFKVPLEFGECIKYLLPESVGKNTWDTIIPK